MTSRRRNLISQFPHSSFIVHRSSFFSFLLSVSLCLCGELLFSSHTDAGEALDDARALYLTGKYAEAEDAYAALAEDDPLRAALGIARCQSSVGELDKAGATLTAAIENAGDAKAAPLAALHAEAARQAFQRGDYAAADEAVAAALRLDEECLAARWFAAESHRVQGRLEEAAAGYEWFVDYYNDHEVADAEALHWIGLGAAQFARWQRLGDQFGFLVNELFPDALKLDENYWPAHYESGLLFLEKYNEAEASQALAEALKLNPNAAEAYAAVARLKLQNYDLDDANTAIARALELNPRLVEAHRLKADALAANFKLEEAISALGEAQQLNPVSEETLGRLASLYLAVDGVPRDIAVAGESRFTKLRDEVLARNPQAGEFFFVLAERLGELRKFPAAEAFYLEAIQRMPQLIGPYAGLGMLYMRMGQEAEAQHYLDQSFEIDPFNVRVSNTLQVLDVLSGYAEIETEHFIVKFDRGQDELLARYAARYLEEQVYPALTAQFGFEPAGKSLFEIFNRAKNTRGHGWFSARMIGLPYIGTVGACAGKMVALASPNDMDTKFNWARVVKHEFVHVLNLQQTNFNIPHWYTEALATINEGYPRPQIWDQLLAARVPTGELFNLDTINLGFVRPQTGLDWQMAYCQAELYAEYMLATYGEDALAKILQCYADNLNTRDALKRSFDVEQEAFEAGYLEYLHGIAAGLSADAEPSPLGFGELQQAHDADPDDRNLAAQLAEAYLERKAYPQARELAVAVLKKDSGHQRAAFVRAKLHLVVGETDEAIALLEKTLDRESPDTKLLGLLASLWVKAKKLDEAAGLYELAAAREPQNTDWTKALARVYLQAGDKEKLTGLLARLAEADADDLVVRKKLLQLALEAQDFASAANWANQAVQIDVLDPDVHRDFAAALVGRQDFAAAIEEYEAAISLRPKDNGLRLDLARACLQTGDAAKGRSAVETVLKRDPDYPGAAELLEELSP